MWDAGAGIKSGLEATPKGLLSKREDESSRDTLSSVLVFTLPSRTGRVEKGGIRSGLQGMSQTRIKIQMTLVQ